MGRSHGKGKGNPLQYSCLENSMDKEAQWTIVHGASKNWAWLSTLSIHTCIPPFCTSLLHYIIYIILYYTTNYPPKWKLKRKIPLIIWQFLMSRIWMLLIWVVWPRVSYKAAKSCCWLELQSYQYGSAVHEAVQCSECVLISVQLFVTPWLQPIRLLCPQNSPGKNTGVDCHFLFHGIFPAQGLHTHL